MHKHFKSLFSFHSPAFKLPTIHHYLPPVMLNLFQHLTLTIINFFKTLYCIIHYLLFLLFLFVLKQKGTEKIQGKSDGSRWLRDRFRPLCRPAHNNQPFLRGIIHFISVDHLR
jgi:hypothetical protein